MAVTLQNTTEYDGDTNGTTHTFAHDSSGGGTNLAIVVGCGTYAGGFIDVSGITYDGDALTVAQESNNGDEGADLYYLVNPNTGAALNVVVTISQSGNIGAGAITASNVHQTTPISDSDVSTTGSITLTTVSGELCVDCFEDWSATETVGAGQTQFVNVASGDTNTAMSYEAATTTSTVMSWTGGSSPAHCALSLKEVAGGGGGSTHHIHLPLLGVG